MAALVADPEIDATAPRAPTEEQWSTMTTEERGRVVTDLPAAMSELESNPPEGDDHRDAKIETQDVLRAYYGKLGLRVYVAADMTVYYPGRRRFAPDVLAVRDVNPHKRMKWVVSTEGKGIDWVLEVHVADDARRDLEPSIGLYASLGIPEYFLFDRGRLRLNGYRLAAPTGRSYQPIPPQLGRYRSAVLGLDLTIEGERLRFYQGTAELLSPADLAVRLERFAQGAAERAMQEAERAAQESARAEQQSARAAQETERAAQEWARAEQESARAKRAEAELAVALAEIERLRKG